MKSPKEMTREELKIEMKGYQKGVNEGGYGYNPYLVELQERDEKESQDRIKNFDNVWNLEVTKTRREEWNSWIRSQDKMTHQKAYDKGQDQGWTIEELKKAIEKHGL